jgi:hypothetical protein
MVRDQQTASAGVTYSQQFGSLQVTLSPAEVVGEGALWRREGTFVWHPGGYTEPDVPVGSQSVEFMSVPGWIAPTARDVVIFDRQPTMVQAAYSPEPGNLQVIISPPEAVADDARWHVDDGPWMSSGTIAGGLAGGIHTVMFSDVAGFAKPAPQQVLIAASQTMIAIGIYRSNSPVAGSPNTTTDSRSLTVLTTDGVTAPAPVLYRTGTSVRVTAPEAPPGFVFDHWSGDLTGSDNPITVVMDRDMTLTANYVPADNTAAAPPLGLCGLGIVEMSLAAIAGLATLPLCTRRRRRINGR